MKFEIKNRFTDAVIFTCELPEEIAAKNAARQLGFAVKEAIKAGANLAGANLAGAYLADANLTGAYLADANLTDANLTGAYLADANLTDANLTGAYLAGAYLADANLTGARHVPAGIEKTDPPEPYERNPSAERYTRRAERFRARNPDVPVIPNIDRQILAAIESGAGKLDMARWHTCETTHCRAGWAVTLAGEAGKKLEEQFGPAFAGMKIYSASTGRVPHFYATDEAALEDIRACAATQVPA